MIINDVYYHPDAVTNILTQPAEKDNGATISYDNDKDEYVMSFKDDEGELQWISGNWPTKDVVSSLLKSLSFKLFWIQKF